MLLEQQMLLMLKLAQENTSGNFKQTSPCYTIANKNGWFKFRKFDQLE